MESVPILSFCPYLSQAEASERGTALEKMESLFILGTYTRSRSNSIRRPTPKKDPNYKRVIIWCENVLKSFC